MPDPNCFDCAQVTGGCWRHNGSGIYVFDQYGMRQTHALVRVATATGWLYFYGSFQPLVVDDNSSCFFREHLRPTTPEDVRLLDEMQGVADAHREEVN